MIYLEMEKSLFDIVQFRLPDVCPNVRFSLIVTDENLHTLGFSSDELCIIAFDVDNDGFRKMMSVLEQLEVDAFNTPDRKEPKRSDPDYQRYLTYGILWDILYNAREINIQRSEIHSAVIFCVRLCIVGKTCQLISISSVRGGSINWVIYCSLSEIQIQNAA